MALQSTVESWFFGPKVRPQPHKNDRYHPYKMESNGTVAHSEPGHCAFFLLGAPTLQHVDQFKSFCENGKTQGHACHLFISADLKDLTKTGFSAFPSNFRVARKDKQPDPAKSKLVPDPRYLMSDERLVSPYHLAEGQMYNAEIQSEITESIYNMIQYAFESGVHVYFANVARAGRVFSFSANDPNEHDPPFVNDMKMAGLLHLPTEANTLTKHIISHTSAGATFMADVTVAVAATALLLGKLPEGESAFVDTPFVNEKGIYEPTLKKELPATGLLVLKSHPAESATTKVKKLVVNKDKQAEFFELHKNILRLHHDETRPRVFASTFCLHDAFLNDMDDLPAVELIKSFTKGPCTIERTFWTNQ